jgi:hypothetical protein
MTVKYIGLKILANQIKGQKFASCGRRWWKCGERNVHIMFLRQLWLKKKLEKLCKINRKRDFPESIFPPLANIIT